MLQEAEGSAAARRHMPTEYERSENNNPVLAAFDMFLQKNVLR